ncbi:hypothetical protein HanPSC8_Chr13g0568781 [Helianthus annuus]|nr:hypothetical protein HanPSC8_Chr13g0568781 [Helianthus annuus]
MPAASIAQILAESFLKHTMVDILILRRKKVLLRYCGDFQIS